MTSTIDVHQAQMHLEEYLLHVLDGEEIVITQEGIPMARLVRYRVRSSNRLPGSAKGMIEYFGDFIEPLPNEIIDTFEA